MILVYRVHSILFTGHADKSEEKDSEISKNAQFRAIQPSPSILSFVEDNVYDIK